MGGKSHKLRFLLLGLLGALLLVWLIGPRIAAPLIRQKLEQMVSRHLNAQLTMEGFSYSFPYGVRAKNAALITKDTWGRQLELVRVGDLELVLAEMPRGSRPLVIEKIIAIKPAFHFARAREGIAGLQDLPRHEKVEPGYKPSDYFRLNYFSIRDGRVEYEDLRKMGSGISKWSGINVELHAQPRSASSYSWELNGRSSPLIVSNARGKVDVDSGLLEIEKLVLGAKARREQALDEIPPGLRDLLRQYDVEGLLSIEGRAIVPLKNLAESRYQATLQLSGGSAKLSEGGGRLERANFKINVISDDAGAKEKAPGAGGAAPQTIVTLELLELGGGDSLLRIERGQALIDPAAGKWLVTGVLGRVEIGKQRWALPEKLYEALERVELSGRAQFTAAGSGPIRHEPDRQPWEQMEYTLVAYPRNVSVKPPKFPLPITGGAGTVQMSGGVVSFENVEANYGADKYLVTAARMPLENIAHEVQLREITGSAELTGRVEDYPHPLELIARHARPMGTWFVMGNWSKRIGQGIKPEFWFDIRCDEGAAALGQKRIPVTGLKCEMSASNTLVEIRRLEGKLLSGEVKAEVKVQPGKPAKYEGKLWARDVDVKALGRALAEDGQTPRRLSGRGNLNVRFAGQGVSGERSAADSFEAHGRLEIIEGDFWDADVMKEVAAGARIKREALTTGQAAGTFDVKNQVVTLKQLTVSSPVLGVQGDGRIGFDKKVDLRVVAAPLADWKEQMKQTKIPVVSEVAGEVLGQLQKLVNAAQRTLLYEFEVKGTTTQPVIKAVPAPVLTKGVAGTFAQMAQGKGAKELVPEEK